MIIETYKEFFHFCKKRLKYLFFLAVLLTPATYIDYHFEKIYQSHADSYSFLMANLMDVVSSVINFMVIAYLYVHWHDHKKFYFFKFIETSMKKLYTVVSAYIWVIAFFLLPFVLLRLAHRYVGKIILLQTDGNMSISQLLYKASGNFNVLAFTIILVGIYIALKASFMVYFAYKTNDRVGFQSLKKAFKINFIEILQYILIIISYFILYSIILFSLGYIAGLSIADTISQTGSAAIYSISSILISFVVTILHIPFEILYVAFAYKLYNKYTK